MEITNTDDNITNNKDANAPAKDEKRRSQREAAKNANVLRKLKYEYEYMKSIKCLPQFLDYGWSTMTSP